MRVKLFTTIFIGLLFGISANAQLQHCYTTEMYNKLVKEHPEVLQTQAALEQFTKQYIANQASQRTTGQQIYIIPLVFHIIHNYGPEDISDAQVLDEVRILNLDYRNLDYDTADVIPAFKAIAADCGIEFRLANIDPNGNCTNGIDRIVSELTYNADDNSKLDPWPDNQYLNIWVVNSLSEAGAAAYAYLPGAIPNPLVDGVIVLSSYIGSIGTSSLTTARTVTHEIGHCLNLYHPWGPTNTPGVECGDDYVDDTPVTEGWDYCDLSGLDCAGTVDNVQNYMEYSFCSNMFTQGQKTRMLAALNSTTDGRNNLWSAANATATGISSPTPNVCAPNADFNVNYGYVCPDKQVQYTDLSGNGQPTSWSWSFQGGTPATSTDSMPVINYTTPGIYSASLTVSNSTGSGSVTKSSVVRVSGTSVTSVPYYQDFTSASSFPGADGYVINPDDGTTWVRTTSAGSSANASIMINNYDENTPGQIDSYVTQAFDLSYVTRPLLTFMVANAQGSSTSTDRLKVYLSLDCGADWQQMYNKAGASLATAGVVTTSFVPGKSQWRMETINLLLYAGNPNVRFKFENTSDGGNNTYIDDISINGTVGINEVSFAAVNFDIYPNPSHGESIISFELLQESNARIHVLDITGREVNQMADIRLNAGQHQFSVSDADFAKGIYFVELIIDGTPAVKKLIVN